MSRFCQPARMSCTATGIGKYAPRPLQFPPTPPNRPNRLPLMSRDLGPRLPPRVVSGTLQPPPPRAMPRALLRKALHGPAGWGSLVNHWTIREDLAAPSMARPRMFMNLPAKTPLVQLSTSQAKLETRMQALQSKFTELLEQVGPASLLFTQFKESANASAHMSRILHAFSAGTLEQYLSCTRNVIELWQSRPDEDASQIPPHVVADFLIDAQRSSTHDRITHCTSASASLKSLRWFARISEWQELDVALQSTLVSAYGRSTCTRDRREAFPMPLSVIARWEHMVYQADTPRPLKLFLGAALARTHTSISFGDAQRVPWHSIQLSAPGLHASCTDTKTTRMGQPFACTWHGLTGRSSDTSWVLHWLGALAEADCNASIAQEGTPDFLFMHCSCSARTSIS